MCIDMSSLQSSHMASFELCNKIIPGTSYSHHVGWYKFHSVIHLNTLYSLSNFVDISYSVRMFHGTSVLGHRLCRNL